MLDPKQKLAALQSEQQLVANNYKEEWNNILTYSEGENLHMMNKRAIDRHYDKLMELYV